MVATLTEKLGAMFWASATLWPVADTLTLFPAASSVPLPMMAAVAVVLTRAIATFTLTLTPETSQRPPAA